LNRIFANISKASGNGRLFLVSDLNWRIYAFVPLGTALKLSAQGERRIDAGKFPEHTLASCQLNPR